MTGPRTSSQNWCHPLTDGESGRCPATRPDQGRLRSHGRGHRPQVVGLPPTACPQGDPTGSIRTGSRGRSPLQQWGQPEGGWVDRANNIQRGSQMKSTTGDTRDLGQVRAMAPAQIMDDYTAHSRQSWNAWMAQACQTGPVRDTVEQLREELRANGKFTYPILIDDNDHSVSHGVRRVCAALLEGHTSLPVATHVDYPDTWAQVSITLAGDISDDDHDPIDDATCVLRLDSGEWVSSGSSRLSGNRYQGGWRCPRGAENELAAAIDAALRKYTPELAAGGLRVVASASPEDESLVVEADVPYLDGDRYNGPGSGLKVLADGVPGHIFVGGRDFASDKVVIDFQPPHPEHGPQFATKYFEFITPGWLDWGHDGRRISIRYP